MTKTAASLNDVAGTLDKVVARLGRLQTTVDDIAKEQKVIIAAIVGVDAKLTKKIDRLDDRVTSIDYLLSDLKNYTEAGFETMNGRFDRLEDRTDRIEAVLDSSPYRH